MCDKRIYNTDNLLEEWKGYENWSGQPGDEVLSGRDVFTYDDQGRLLTASNYYTHNAWPDPTEELVEEHAYTWENENRTITVARMDHDPPFETRYTFDEDCRLELIEHIQQVEDVGPLVSQKSLVYYDDYELFDRREEWSCHASSDPDEYCEFRLTSSEQYEHDTEGRLTQEDTLNADGTLNNRTTYSYWCW